MPDDQFARSRVRHERAKLTLAGGIASAIRATQNPVPICFERGAGSRLWDTDGNTYIDYTLSYGPLLLGHSPNVVLRAVRKQLGKGLGFGASHRHEAELSEALCRTVPSIQLCVFSSTGSEAVQAALRIARAATGRQRIVKFFGHYHGWMDSVNVGNPGQTTIGAATGGQDPLAFSSTTVCEWNDLEALRSALSNDVAAVIMEPFNVNGGCIAPLPGYLEAACELIRMAGSLLIFDEVVTGYRLSLGGAQGVLRIVPDLTVLGKAMGGGFPIGAVGGRSDVMEVVASGRVAHMGNFNANPISACAAVAAVSELEEHAPYIYPKLRSDMASLSTMIEQEAGEAGLPIRVNLSTGIAHAFVSELPVVTHEDWAKCDQEAYRDFAESLLREGIHVTPRGVLLVSTVHTDEDLEMTRSAIRRAVRRAS